MIDLQCIEVDTLEAQARWEEAKDLLLKEWKKDPNNPVITIRLAFLAWYLLVESGPLQIDDLDFDELETILREVTCHALSTFNTNPTILWCFGYMTSLFPYHFGDYDYWEEKGKAMLKQAHDLDPTNPVFLASISEEVPKELKTYFKGEGVLSQYFRDVWRL